MKKQTYTMIQSDIDGATKESFENNPITRAIKRKIHRNANSSAYFRDVYYQTSSGYTRSFWLPKKAIDLINKFDAGKKVKPITFTIVEKTSDSILR